MIKLLNDADRSRRVLETVAVETILLVEVLHVSTTQHTRHQQTRAILACISASCASTWTSYTSIPASVINNAVMCGVVICSQRRSQDFTLRGHWSRAPKAPRGVRIWQGVSPCPTD